MRWEEAATIQFESTETHRLKKTNLRVDQRTSARTSHYQQTTTVPIATPPHHNIAPPRTEREIWGEKKRISLKERRE
ncbi:hypothetical protein VIGAN_01111200 [Vigna angularis var. angularis]|uniref:Uncharacterized protein n=1 Tax=Vigna angularis var. angularis TaxID=157739 RepID=A0A0S3QZ47_PHAAN|nr:hypothetical protein VIGAN_01111200 [Vigna angularis var. angularis]